MRTTAVAAGDTASATQYNNLRKDALPASYLYAHEQSSPGLTLYVEAGNYYYAGALVEFAGGNSPSFTAPAANPRIDILSINSAGTLVRTAGSEAASPTAPKVPAGNIPIAQIYNRVGQSSVKDTSDGSNGYIQKDLRYFIADPKLANTKLYASATAVTISNTTETNLISTTLPGGTLGTDGIIRMRFYVPTIFNSGGSNTITIRIKLGSTTLITHTFTPTDSRSADVEIELMGDGATNAQDCLYKLLNYQEGSGTVILIKRSTGTATEDSTTDLTLAVTCQRSQNESGGFVANYFQVEKII